MRVAGRCCPNFRETSIFSAMDRHTKFPVTTSYIKLNPGIFKGGVGGPFPFASLSHISGKMDHEIAFILERMRLQLRQGQPIDRALYDKLSEVTNSHSTSYGTCRVAITCVSLRYSLKTKMMF